jgi:hypothetical protein
VRGSCSCPRADPTIFSRQEAELLAAAWRLSACFAISTTHSGGCCDLRRFAHHDFEIILVIIFIVVQIVFLALRRFLLLLIDVAAKVVAAFGRLYRLLVDHCAQTSE